MALKPEQAPVASRGISQLNSLQQEVEAVRQTVLDQPVLIERADHLDEDKPRIEIAVDSEYSVDGHEAELGRSQHELENIPYPPPAWPVARVRKRIRVQYRSDSAFAGRKLSSPSLPAGLTNRLDKKQRTRGDGIVSDLDSDSEVGLRESNSTEHLAKIESGPRYFANFLFLSYKMSKAALMGFLSGRNIHHHISRVTLRSPSNGISPTISTTLKRSIEASFRGPILWWPLSTPRCECDEEESTVSWNCSCGASLNINLSSPHAEAFCRQIRQMTQVPSQPPLLPIHEAEGSQKGSMTPRSSQSNINSSGNRSSPGPPDPGNSDIGMGHTIPMTTSSSVAQAQASQKFLHWCVDTSPGDTRLAELDIKEITDRNMVPSLLEKYQALRGLRACLTLTSYAGARLIKFHKLFEEGEHVTVLENKLPCRNTNKDYEYKYYDPSMPEKDFVRVVEGIIALRISKPKCPATLRLGCLIEYVPKKVNGKMQRLNGYDIYAVSAYCFWKAAVVLIVASIPSVVFMVRWLIGHKGDWQNALGWLAVTYSLLNILVLQHDRWSVEKARL